MVKSALVQLKHRRWRIAIVETMPCKEKNSLVVVLCLYPYPPLLSTIMHKIFGTLGKIPEILKPQVIFFLQLVR